MKPRQIACSIALAAFSMLTIPAVAQTNPSTPAVASSNAGVLEVQGQGSMLVQPDQTAVRIQVQGTNTEAGRAVQLTTEKVEQLLKQLQEAGFKKDEIKTSSFYLHENNQWLNDKMVRQGYTASQTIEVKFPLDPNRMTKITNVFAQTQEGVTFQFAFGLSEKLRQQVKEELIRKALQDAREKAAVIARSANIRLGSIRKIDYGAAALTPYGPVAMQESAMMDKRAQFPQTEIQEIELSDHILVVWSLEQ